MNKGFYGISNESNDAYVGRSFNSAPALVLGNTFIGFQSGDKIQTDATGTNGASNTFIGYQTGLATTTGYLNTFIGSQTGMANTTGYGNTFIGSQTGMVNTTGYGNTFIGSSIGNKNTTGYGNTFIGYNTGGNTSTGISNTFIGYNSAIVNSSGSYNVLIGGAGGYNNGSYNTFTGYQCGNFNLSGQYNTLYGYAAGSNVNNGNYNTFMGSNSGLGSTLTSITSASGNGTTVTFIAPNNLVAGQVISTFGTSGGTFNFTNATVASANSSQFTVTNSTTGSSTGGTFTLTTNYATAYGTNTYSGNNGSVAIGTDASGNGASTNVQNQFVLGTTNHNVVAPGTISSPVISSSGLTGATAASRYVGATASGAPTSGTFAVGDHIVDQTGTIWICTTAGTPGTWLQTSARNVTGTVAVANGGTGATTASAALTNLGALALTETVSGKNYIINGGMDIWQRGTSFTSVSSPSYVADRWQVNATGGTGEASWAQVTSGVNGIKYALRTQRISGQTSTSGIYIGQSLESLNSIPMAGQTVTLSFYATAGSNFSASGNAMSVAVYSGTGTDQNVYTGFTGSTTLVSTNATLTTSWQQFTYTFSVASTATQLGLFVGFNPTGTAGTNDYFDLTGVQLEISPTATPFSRAGGSIGNELSLCQRYYFRNTATANLAPLGPMGICQTSSIFYCPIQPPVTMRAAPASMDLSSIYAFTPSGGSYTASFRSLTGSTAGYINAAFNISGATAGASLYVVSSSSSGYLGFSAEL